MDRRVLMLWISSDQNSKSHFVYGVICCCHAAGSPEFQSSKTAPIFDMLELQLLESDFPRLAFHMSVIKHVRS